MRVSPSPPASWRVPPIREASRLDRVPNGDWGARAADRRGRGGHDRVRRRLRPARGAARPRQSGRFDVKGSLVGEAGPVREGRGRNARPARYRGETDGQRMSLEVTLEEGDSGGTSHSKWPGATRQVPVTPLV